MNGIFSWDDLNKFEVEDLDRVHGINNSYANLRLFGPKPRSYNLDMNRKERRLALRTALMSRVKDIKAVEDFGSTLNQPKTSEIINGLARLGIEKSEKVLVILDSPSDVIKKSINNIEKVKLIAADQLNVFDILNANKLVIGQSAINKIQEVYAS